MQSQYIVIHEIQHLFEWMLIAFECMQDVMQHNLRGSEGCVKYDAPTLGGIARHPCVLCLSSCNGNCNIFNISHTLSLLWGMACNICCKQSLTSLESCNWCCIQPCSCWRTGQYAALEKETGIERHPWCYFNLVMDFAMHAILHAISIKCDAWQYNTCSSGCWLLLNACKM